MGTNVHVVNNSGAYKEKMEDAVYKFLYAAGEHIEGEAKTFIESDPRRVDTGLLRNSIAFAIAGEAPSINRYHASYGEKFYDVKNKKRYKAWEENAGSVKIGFYNGTAPTEDGPNVVYIGTNVEYGIYVHEGTKRMTPNRFLKNAIMGNLPQLKEKLEEIISEEMNK